MAASAYPRCTDEYESLGALKSSSKMYAGGFSLFQMEGASAHSSVPVIEGETMAAGDSVPGIKFWWRFSSAALFVL